MAKKEKKRSLAKDLLVTSLYALPMITIGKAIKLYVEKFDKEDERSETVDKEKIKK